MNEPNGFIKIHRKLAEWGWYQDSIVKSVFLHLLLNTNFREKQWMGETIKVGQVVIGTNKMASELGITRQQVRTALNKLKSTNEITIKSTNKFSIVTIVNWGNYQIEEKKSTSKSTNRLTNEQPTNNHQSTINQPQLKNDKNVKNEKKKEYVPVRHHSPLGEVASMGGSLDIELDGTIGNPIPKGMSVEEYERRKAEARL